MGNAVEVSAWGKLFDASVGSPYQARKGITTDVNGIYFVNITSVNSSSEIKISNDPRNGRRSDVKKKTAIVEKRDIFPLLRGRDVHRFVAKPQADQCVIVPQRGMSGDPSLPVTCPKTFKYLSQFQNILEHRSSYKRFQKGQPFWSIWSTGAYTFSPYKVVWKEMSGNGFVSAYISDADFDGANKLIIPDHKVYFVPLDDEHEAAYLSAFLNSRIVSHAINSYSSALSLGTSVTDYLKIPEYDSNNALMRELADMSIRFHYGDVPTDADEKRMDEIVEQLI